MAMEKVKFLKDIEVPNIAVTGDLNVSGSVVTENVENVLTKGAVTVINADNNELKTTLMGTVIRTGTGEDYAMVYDPSDEAVRLGVGVYDSENNTFNFNEGEGNPIAVRNITNNGSLVMWDAEKYCLVDAPISVNENNEMLVNMGLDGKSSVVEVRPETIRIGVCPNFDIGSTWMDMNYSNMAVYSNFGNIGEMANPDYMTSFTIGTDVTASACEGVNITSHHNDINIEACGGEIEHSNINLSTPNGGIAINGGIPSGKHSISSGIGTKATAQAQTVIGKYNKENDEALFIIGNGTGESSSDRSNAFEVLKNGSVSINGVNITNEQLTALLSLGSITVTDIDEICGAPIVSATSSEVTF